MPDLTVVGTPSSAGAFAPGQELAPQALRAAGLVERLRSTGLTVEDAGDGPVQRWAPDRGSPLAQNVGQVAGAVAFTDAAVQAALRSSSRVLVLGGDCTVGTGSFQALRRDQSGAGLIYLDLDADMNVPDSSDAGALDWMGLGMLLGLPGAVGGIVELGQLAPERLVLLGFFDGKSTQWELEHLERLDITRVPDTSVRQDAGAAARRALGSLPADTSAVAVHVDVDVIDFTDAPLSEDANRNLGVSLDDAMTALRALLDDARVRVVTVCQLNPQHAVADERALPRFVDGLVRALGRPRRGSTSATCRGSHDRGTGPR